MSTLSTGTDASPTGSPRKGGLCGSTNGFAPCLITDNGLPECCSLDGYCGTDNEHCLVPNNCQYGCLQPSFFLLPATALPSSLSSLQRQVAASSTATPSSTHSSSITSTTSPTTLQTTTSSHITSSSLSSLGTHSPSPTSSPAVSGSTKHSHTGAIAGGVVGGIAGIVIIIWLIWCCTCRNRNRRTVTPEPRPVRPVSETEVRQPDPPSNYPPYQSNFQTDSNFRVFENGEDVHQGGQPGHRGGL